VGHEILWITASSVFPSLPSNRHTIVNTLQLYKTKVARMSPSVRAAELFRRADAFEYAWCLRLNRSCRQTSVRTFFAVISRLGNGAFWYALMVVLPILYGSQGVVPAIRMAVVGVVGVAIYKALKSRLVRERPYISLAGIEAGTRPLDRYSFPSGHTLHAVSFSVVIVDSCPELAVLVVPFACLVAASRVVLGLHYPSDVLAGAGLGIVLAVASIQFTPNF
jgi:undecaprenyl-diphosphatase